MTLSLLVLVCNFQPGGGLLEVKGWLTFSSVQRSCILRHREAKWQREGQLSRLLSFLNRQPQHVVPFHLCFFLFSSLSCYLPSFSLSLSFSCTHKRRTLISGIPFAPRLVWSWKEARRKHAVQSKRMHDVILTSTKLLVQRLIKYKWKLIRHTRI